MSKILRAIKKCVLFFGAICLRLTFPLRTALKVGKFVGLWNYKLVKTFSARIFTTTFSGTADAKVSFSDILSLLTQAFFLVCVLYCELQCLSMGLTKFNSFLSSELNPTTTRMEIARIALDNILKSLLSQCEALRQLELTLTARHAELSRILLQLESNLELNRYQQEGLITAALQNEGLLLARAMPAQITPNFGFSLIDNTLASILKICEIYKFIHPSGVAKANELIQLDSQLKLAEQGSKINNAAAPNSAQQHYSSLYLDALLRNINQGYGHIGNSSIPPRRR